MGISDISQPKFLELTVHLGNKRHKYSVCRGEHHVLVSVVAVMERGEGGNFAGLGRWKGCRDGNKRHKYSVCRGVHHVLVSVVAVRGRG